MASSCSTSLPSKIPEGTECRCWHCSSLWPRTNIRVDNRVQSTPVPRINPELYVCVWIYIHMHIYIFPAGNVWSAVWPYTVHCARIQIKMPNLSPSELSAADNINKTDKIQLGRFRWIWKYVTRCCFWRILLRKLTRVYIKRIWNSMAVQLSVLGFSYRGINVDMEWMIPTVSRYVSAMYIVVGLHLAHITSYCTRAGILLLSWINCNPRMAK